MMVVALLIWNSSKWSGVIKLDDTFPTTREIEGMYIPQTSELDSVTREIFVVRR